MTAAVSARRTLSPNPTVGRPDASSSVLHPPSGPTATTCWASVGRSPLSWASTTSPGPPRADRSANGDGVADVGQPDAAALRGRLARHPAQLLDARLAPGTGPAHDAALGAQRNDAVDPQLGQLLDHPFGTLPLDGAKATVRAGSARASNCTEPSPPMPVAAAIGSSVARAPPRGARPAAQPVGGDDLLAVTQPQHPAEMVRVLVGQHRVRRIVHEDLRRLRPPARRLLRAAMPALAKGGAQAREHAAVAAPSPRGGDRLAA